MVSFKGLLAPHQHIEKFIYSSPNRTAKEGSLIMWIVADIINSFLNTVNKR